MRQFRITRYYLDEVFFTCCCSHIFIMYLQKWTVIKIWANMHSKTLLGPNLRCFKLMPCWMIQLEFSASVPHLDINKTSSSMDNGGMLRHPLYLYSPSPLSKQYFPILSICTEHFSGATTVPCISISEMVTLSLTVPHGVFTATSQFRLALVMRTNLSSKEMDKLKMEV